MNNHLVERNPRILVVDDSRAIHDDFTKILGNQPDLKKLDAAANELFGQPQPYRPSMSFELDSAFQGQEGIDKLEHAMASGRPYAIAFVDVRMPPGLDGIETANELWKRCPDLEIVICTAYADYSWEDMLSKLGQSERFLILKKPFDNIEVLQLASALTEKWRLRQEARGRMDDLERIVAERTRDLQSAMKQLEKNLRDREAAELAARQSEARFVTIFRSSPAAISIHTVHSGRFIEVNHLFCEFSGYRRDELVGRPIAELEFWASAEERASVTQRLLKKGAIHALETRYRNRAGELRDVLLTLELIQLTGESEPVLISMLTDVTEKKRLEAQFLRAQRLEGIGTLASGIAHDINNVLAPVTLATSMLQLKAWDDEGRRLLDTVDMCAQRAAGVVQQVLTFTRGVEGRRLALTPAALFDELIKMLKPTLPKNISIAHVIAPNVWSVNGDPTQLHQVLLNLCINARDAMPEGGRLSLSSENVVMDDISASMIHGGKAGEFVVLRVADTGEGISPAIVDKIFEPFFTTKQPGKGTGLGLSTLLGIVRSHGGFVDVSSEPNHGAAFSVYLPAMNAVTETVAESEVSEAPLGAGSTVLIVDDEESIRSVTAKFLTQNGYQVLAAADGAEALEVFEQNRDCIDLIVTDLMMPNMDGLQLVRAVRQRCADVKITVMSGTTGALTDPKKRAELESLATGTFLMKPFSARQFLQTIHNELRRNSK